MYWTVVHPVSEQRIRFTNLRYSQSVADEAPFDVLVITPAGRRVTGDVRRIAIRHHSQIVVEVSGYVPPHAHYVFPRAS